MIRFRIKALAVVFLVVASALASGPIAVGGISLYQQYISPYKGYSCPHATLHGGPSCSAYIKEKVAAAGILAGLAAAKARFHDCHLAALTISPNECATEIPIQGSDDCMDCCKNPERTMNRAIRKMKRKIKRELREVFGEICCECCGA